MRKLLFTGVVLALATSVASAQMWAGPAQGSRVPTTPNVAGAATPRQPGSVCVYPIPLAGIESWDAFGSANNIVDNFDLAACAGLPSGTPVTMNGIGWDVTLFADVNVGSFGGSWLQEVAGDFDDSAQSGASEFFLTPGAGDTFSGTATYTSGGIIKLGDVGLPDLQLNDGILRIEFFETFDDAPGVVDGAWLSGAMFLQIAQVPEPMTLSLLALGGLAVLRRRAR